MGSLEHRERGRSIARAPILSTARPAVKRGIGRGAAAAGLGVLAYWLARGLEGAYIDDTFITLQYARQLLENGQWGLVEGLPSHTATSPWNVLLLAALTALVGDGVHAVAVSVGLSTAILAAILGELSMRETNGRLAGWTACAAFVANPLVVSSFGLEGLWLAVGLAAMVLCRVRGHDDALAGATVFAIFVRPDAVVAGAILVGTLPGPRRARASVITALGLVPWAVASWTLLGSVLPGTLFLKTSQGSWGRWTFFDGPRLYFERFPLETAASGLFVLPFLVTAALALARSSRRGRRSEAWSSAGWLAALAVADYAAYSLLVVPPYHWYYVPVIFAGTTAAALWGFAARGSAGRFGRGLALAVALSLLAPAAVTLRALVADAEEMPIHTNFATHARYREIGLWLSRWLAHQEIDGAITLDGEVGTLTYYCQCTLLNDFSDYRILDRSRRQRYEKHVASRVFYRLDTIFLDLDAVDYPPSVRLLSTLRPRETFVGEPERRFSIGTRWMSGEWWLVYGSPPGSDGESHRAR